jgi:hypothetical protein
MVSAFWARTSNCWTVEVGAREREVGCEQVDDGSVLGGALHEQVEEVEEGARVVLRGKGCGVFGDLFQEPFHEGAYEVGLVGKWRKIVPIATPAVRTTFFGRVEDAGAVASRPR